MHGLVQTVVVPRRESTTRPYYTAFHFDFRSATRRKKSILLQGFDCGPNDSHRWMMDRAIGKGEGGSTCCVAPRCVTLRYVWVTDLFWKNKRIVSKRRKKKKIKEMTCETLVIALFYRIVTRESGGGAIIGYSFRWSTRNCPSIVADRTAESISIYMDEHKL